MNIQLPNQADIFVFEHYGARFGLVVTWMPLRVYKREGYSGTYWYDRDHEYIRFCGLEISYFRTRSK